MKLTYKYGFIVHMHIANIQIDSVWHVKLSLVALQNLGCTLQVCVGFVYAYLCF